MLCFDSKLKELKSWVKRHPRDSSILLSVKHSIVCMFSYVYGEYLTVRHVDKYKKFAAIVFRYGLFHLHIRNRIGTKLFINDLLIV
jgi:hypothetical protein